MALDAQMDIVPVVISEYDFYHPGERRFDKGVATIRILKPIETKVRFIAASSQTLINHNLLTYVFFFLGVHQGNSGRVDTYDERHDDKGAQGDFVPNRVQESQLKSMSY